MSEFLLNLSQFSDWGFFVLRLTVGFIFLYHGLAKRPMWRMQPSEQMGGSMLGILRLLSIVEPLGGIAMIMGFWTQIAAAGFMLIMLGALYFKIRIWKAPFTANNTTGWEFDLLLLAASIAIMFGGAGATSLDGYLF